MQLRNQIYDMNDLLVQLEKEYEEIQEEQIWFIINVIINPLKNNFHKKGFYWYGIASIIIKSGIVSLSTSL